MQPSLSVRRSVTALVFAAASLVYLIGLTATGTLDPDEPRYASIGREMAHSGDWITPRLWGEPWFEKPALLYWMTATAYSAGLPDDLAPRLPVALASVAFLVFLWKWLKRQYDERVAWYSTAILATTVGWFAYSRFGLTDLPLTVCFASAMLLICQELDRRQESTSPLSSVVLPGLFLGLAVLAKGLLPYVLFLPALWFLRGRIRTLIAILAVSVLVAGPWYVLVTARNGMPFINEFILKHHFGRFTSPTLQHVRPFWFYLPVMLGAIFPWTPAVVLLFDKKLYAARGERFLLTWLLFGFVFFSASTNKLPGYLLPLLPPTAILVGLSLARSLRLRWLLGIAGALPWCIPTAAAILPEALSAGLSRASFPNWQPELVPLAIVSGIVYRMDRGRFRDFGVSWVAALTGVFVCYVVWTTYPVLDRTVSARPFWKESLQTGKVDSLCVADQPRAWRYGLNYYAGKSVPNCTLKP